MLDAESGRGVRQISFVADTVSAGPVGSGPVASQTHFSVDLEQVQKLMDGLIDAHARIQELYDQTIGFVVLDSPGKDPYSEAATAAIARTAGGAPGGYGWAGYEAIDFLNDTIQKIKASLDAYQDQEQENADAFKGEGNKS